MQICIAHPERSNANLHRGFLVSKCKNAWMDKKAEQRVALRAYYRAVLDETKWSAATWAKIAGTTSTNITRMTSEKWETAPVPGVDTVAKLFGAVPSNVKVLPPKIFGEAVWLSLSEDEQRAAMAYRKLNEAQRETIWHGILGPMSGMTRVAPCEDKESA